MSHATVVDKKHQFLRQQKHILARGIAPSVRLRAIADRAGIQAKVFDDVMLKVNRDIKRHSRIIHSRQMTEHVVEQIDLLYWEAGAPSLVSEAETTAGVKGENDSALHRGDDLTLDKHISKLPVTWSATGDDEDAEDRDAYITAVARLQDLSAKRLALQHRLMTYQTLLSLLEPYRNSQKNVQPNLVSRDAPLTTELTKTRTLAIRVAGRVGEKYGDNEVPASTESEDTDMVEDDGTSKLQKIVSGW